MTTTASSQKALSLLNDEFVVAAGGQLNGGGCCLGYSRVRGFYKSATAAAANQPQIRFSFDAVTWSIVRVIPVDPSQANFTYPFDLPVEGRYVSVNFTDGGAGGSVIGVADLLPAT